MRIAVKPPVKGVAFFGFVRTSYQSNQTTNKVRRWGWYAYRYSYHGVVWFPFCLLVEAKLGRRLCRLDIADYQNTGLWVGNKDMGKKISSLYMLQVPDI